jgi:hypothetical protein
MVRLWTWMLLLTRVKVWMSMMGRKRDREEDGTTTCTTCALNCCCCNLTGGSIEGLGGYECPLILLPFCMFARMSDGLASPLCYRAAT